jgi:hypothetical protein
MHLIEEIPDAPLEFCPTSDQSEVNQRLADNVTNAHSRIERAERILENNLDAPSHLPELGARQVVNAPALKANLAFCQCSEAEHCTSESGFAAPALANQRQCLAASDGKVHTIDRMDDLYLLSVEEAAADPEVFLEPYYF